MWQSPIQWRPLSTGLRPNFERKVSLFDRIRSKFGALDSYAVSRGPTADSNQRGLVDAGG